MGTSDDEGLWALEIVAGVQCDFGALAPAVAVALLHTQLDPSSVLGIQLTAVVVAAL